MIPDVNLISLRFGRLRGAMPPLGSLSLVGALEAKGIHCRLTDTQFDAVMNPFAVDALANHIISSAAPILAFSVFNDSVPLLIAALCGMVDRLAGRRVFVGGPGVVGIARRLLERVSAIEMVIVGEGETAFPLAIGDPGRASLMPGVYTRNNDGTVTGAGRTPREDLNAIAPVPWEHAKGKGYKAVPWSTMRGCPFDCQFCEITAFMGRRVTMRSISHSLEDLERAMDILGTKDVKVVDDTFTVSKRRVMEMCRALKARGFNLSFEIFSRTDTLDREMMEALAEAGCVRVFFGVDAGDDDVLSRISKGLHIEEAERTIRQAAGFFEVTASFIWGYPFESITAFRRMLSLAYRLYDLEERFRVWPQLHLLSPSAGTPLFEQFSSTLKLDLNVETLPIGSRLSTCSFQSTYDKVLDIIAADALLAAPFYYYQTPDYYEKRAAIEEFNRLLDREVGLLVLRQLSDKREAHAHNG